MLSWEALVPSRDGLFVVVKNLGMSSGLKCRSAKMPAGFICLGELTMSVGNGRLNIVGTIKNIIIC